MKLLDKAKVKLLEKVEAELDRSEIVLECFGTNVYYSNNFIKAYNSFGEKPIKCKVEEKKKRESWQNKYEVKINGSVVGYVGKDGEKWIDENFNRIRTTHAELEVNFQKDFFVHLRIQYV